MIGVFGTGNIIVLCEIGDKKIFDPKRHAKSQIIAKSNATLSVITLHQMNFGRGRPSSAALAAVLAMLIRILPRLTLRADAAQYLGPMSVDADRDPLYPGHGREFLGR